MMRSLASFLNSPKIPSRTWRGAQSERACQGQWTAPSVCYIRYAYENYFFGVLLYYYTKAGAPNENDSHLPCVIWCRINSHL